MTTNAHRFSVPAVAAALLLSCGAALAGTFSLSPLRLDLSGGAKTAVLTVHNEESTAVLMQADVFFWEQPEGGEDKLTASRDLLVSPAVFTLPPNGSQIVRVALRRGTDPQRELAYRLSLQEVPQPASPDFNGLKVALRMTLPVFVAPAAAATPQLEWSAHVDDQSRIVVTAQNTGTAHARILNFSVAAASGTAATLEQPALAYVLAGQSRHWTFENPKNDKTRKGTKLSDAHLLRLKGKTDQGEVATELVLQR
ncbi:MAG TPA: molecular chaperone, partial [Steroidobacteraceae bacterium]|nr:molecular chaperone [Steroidobacteraceae bacterium]